MTVEENLLMGGFRRTSLRKRRLRPKRCSTNTAVWRIVVTNPPGCCQAATVAVWKSRGHLSCSRRFCWLTNHPSVWSHALSTWYSKFLTTFSARTARRSSWLSRSQEGPCLCRYRLCAGVGETAIAGDGMSFLKIRCWPPLPWRLVIWITEQGRWLIATGAGVCDQAGNSTFLITITCVASVISMTSFAVWPYFSFSLVTLGGSAIPKLAGSMVPILSGMFWQPPSCGADRHG